jgi:hypothetical protein
MASETPWWSNLVAIVLTAAVSILGTMYALKPAAPGMSRVPTMGALVKDTITYIPHILLLFGVLADMFSTTFGVYSIPSLVGLLSVFANWIFKYFWMGVFDLFAKIAELVASRPGQDVSAPPPMQMTGGRFFEEYDGCSIQGFKWAESKYAPQTLVVTATVFSYYMFDLIYNQGAKSAVGVIVVFGVFYIMQMLIVGDCNTEDPDQPNKYLKGIMALAEGLLFGGSSYAIVQGAAPSRLPTSMVNPFPRVSQSDLKPGPDGSLVDDEGRPYTVLPNGQVVPDLCNPESRSEFGKLLSQSFGAVSPPSTCPTS